MSGGGKGAAPAPTVAPTYTDPQTGKSFTSPDALNSSIDERNRQAAEQQKLDEAAATQAALDKRNQFNSALSGAQTRARGQAQNYFTSRGLSADPYNSAIEDMINQSTSTVPDLAPNPDTYFANNIGETILNNSLRSKIDAKTGQLSSVFTPDYATKWMPYSEATPIVNTELSNSFDPLTTQLDNAHKRGVLNDVGYSGATTRLNQDRNAAQSQISSIAQGIIDANRSNVNDYITGAKNDVANASIYNVDSLDPNSYFATAADRVNSLRGRLAGDVRSAVGDTTYSDLLTLLNAGGVVQGATNPTVAGGALGNNLASGYVADQILNKKPRGIGNYGAF